jgi:4-amino-4-deoxy-L-arabinose transferase-like glycosyltransferase
MEHRYLGTQITHFLNLGKNNLMFRPAIPKSFLQSESIQLAGRLILLFIFSSAYLYPFVRVLWRIGDEGSIVYGAQLVSEGAIPYRDFFEVMGPASFYWLAIFFKIFGIKWMVSRLVLLLTVSISTIIIYWMTRRLYAGPFDVLPAFFFLMTGVPLWPGVSHHWDSIFFALLSFGTFLLWQDSERRWLLGVAGVLSGLTSCFIQQKGVLLVLALLLAIYLNERKSGEDRSKMLFDMGSLLGGFFLVGVIVLIFFSLVGGFHNLIYDNLLWPLSNYHNVNITPYGYTLNEFLIPRWKLILAGILPYSILQAILGIFTLQFVIILILPVLVFAMAILLSLDSTKRPLIFNLFTIPYWIAALALWLSEIHRKDLMHIIWGSPLLFVIFYFIWHISFEKSRMLRLLGISLIMISLTLFGTFNILIATSADCHIVTRRGPIYSHNNDTALRFLNDQVKKEEYAFVYPYYPMYYFLAGIRNPTEYSILMYNINTKAQFRKAIIDLDQKKARYILWDTYVEGHRLKTWFPQYEHPSSNKLEIERYIETHYRFFEIRNGFKIMKRKEE